MKSLPFIKIEIYDKNEENDDPFEIKFPSIDNIMFSLNILEGDYGLFSRYLRTYMSKEKLENIEGKLFDNIRVSYF